MILFSIVLILFVLVCIFLCFLVLIQSDKGGGISSALGGGLSGAGNLLGTQDTANLLTRATTGSAILFMALCIVLSLFLSNPDEKGQKSVLKERAEKQQNFAPSSVLSGEGLPISGEPEPTEQPAVPGNTENALPIQQETPEQ